MTTLILKPRNKLLNKEELRTCIDIIQEGGLVVFPTDTVYGVGCNAFNWNSVRRIYSLKGRHYHKPLPILLGDVHQINLVAKEISLEAQHLMKAFWPGALTLIFKTAPLALHATRGKSTVAVRIPALGLIRQILAHTPFPLAATSANKSGQKSLKTGAEVRIAFEGKVDLIIDGGPCQVGHESTVLDVTHYPFSVLREGAIKKSKLYYQLNPFRQNSRIQPLSPS